MGKNGKGLDKEGLADVLGVVSGATGGAALALGGPSSVADAFVPPQVDVATLAAGGVGGYALARSQGASGVAGAVAGAVGAVALRSMLGF